ncbi:peptidylprolyl isomerase [Vibrio parahaemolyticus]|nr:peptidylprolyl isomerase [Vibrio parahaemolyticus]
MLRKAILSLALLSCSVWAGPKVAFETTLGSFTVELNEEKAPIKNEGNNGLNNDRATIAMARTNAPDSATRQFFVNLVDNDFLNYGARPPGYAVFGEVTEGFDVIEKMAQQPTTTVGRMRDVPETQIVITKATLLK